MPIVSTKLRHCHCWWCCFSQEPRPLLLCCSYLFSSLLEGASILFRICNTFWLPSPVVDVVTVRRLPREVAPPTDPPPRLVQSNYHAPCLPLDRAGRGVCVLFVLLFARRRHRRFGWWKVYNFIRPYRNWVSVAFSCISRRRRPRRVTTWQQPRCSDSCCHAL